ncbi:MAG TPA: YciI family protein [Jatrophihabitans sp.]|jgi:uncharacterized protein YciI|nr:YciI family protein [Jatrophihabitans sp.]
MPLFTVRMVGGPAWDASRARRDQSGWAVHAAFMDRLVAIGAVVLGGPIGDGSQVLLVVDAADEAAIHDSLDADPWVLAGVLRIGEIERWAVWLDGRQSRGPR